MEKASKLYFSIGEVSKKIGVEAYVLRYWESEFHQLRPRKNSSGRRIYTKDDMKLLRQIYDLLRVRKYTLEGARQALQGEQEKSADRKAERDELLRLRLFLENIRRQLA